MCQLGSAKPTRPLAVTVGPFIQRLSPASAQKRRLRATPLITSTFENVSVKGVCLGLSLGPPAIARVRSKRGAVQDQRIDRDHHRAGFDPDRPVSVAAEQQLGQRHRQHLVRHTVDVPKRLRAAPGPLDCVRRIREALQNGSDKNDPTFHFSGRSKFLASPVNQSRTVAGPAFCPSSASLKRPSAT